MCRQSALARAAPCSSRRPLAKRVELAERQKAQAELGHKIDKMMARAGAGDAPRGCFSSLLEVLFVSAHGLCPCPRPPPPLRYGQRRFARRVRACSGKKIDANAKLVEAADAMRARVEQLEQRAADQRAEAKRLMQAGQKPAAMRALKKANATGKLAESNQAAVDAVEQQLDALTGRNPEGLASALASTSKRMKSDSKALGKAEAAIDDASEARDMANDLSQVMAEFAANGQGAEDEDELLAELDALASEDPGPALPPVAARATMTSEAQAAAALEAKHAEWDAANALRSRLPPVPDGSRVERTGLLAVA